MDPRFHSFQAEVERWHWWYAVRREILDAKLAPLPIAPSAGRVRPRLLDLGCGTGGASLVLHRYGEAVAFDRADGAFALAPDRPYAHRVVGAADGALPFCEGAFDAAVALDVLEHLDDDHAAIAELGRVVRPGGFLVVFVPAFMLLWGYNDVFSHHRRRYRAAQLGALVAGGPFRVREAGYFNLALFLPTLGARLLQRALPRSTEGMEHAGRPGLLNDLLTLAFRAELPWLRRRPLPVGTSAFCVAERVAS
jgi:SAM-dependent methyltransferase